ncbi:MAG: hypothetical protein ACD_2C00092G0006 [uncultured bacterium (gcode 4)]|uniref:Uncharacterized protein n=1 Tax=uncultured bacterium (gcode 4) TaxID=1234023 RepID=K2G3K0_9BACT|nr:MAG: hypothetical protein ACD_2C00092G0006 [uncultured bacterium (gcode 4)]
MNTHTFLCKKVSKKHWGRKRYLSVFRKYVSFADGSLSPKPPSWFDCPCFITLLASCLGPLGVVIADDWLLRNPETPIVRHPCLPAGRLNSFKDPYHHSFVISTVAERY